MGQSLEKKCIATNFHYSMLGQGDLSMEDARPLKRLEEELEQVRKKLHQSVKGEPSRLLDPTVLPISRELDLLIVQYQYLKHGI
jgi:hypothetical protein